MKKLKIINVFLILNIFNLIHRAEEVPPIRKSAPGEFIHRSSAGELRTYFSPGSYAGKLPFKLLHQHIPPLMTKDVRVLQQDSSIPFQSRGSDIETQGNGTVVGTPGLTWRNVRKEEGTNCGYHALKNSTLMLESLHHSDSATWHQLSDPSRELSRQLQSQDILIPHIATKAPTIYQQRKKKVIQELTKKGVSVPDNPSDSFFLQHRSKLVGDTQDYVNANDGHIKTETLNEDEMEKLLQTEPRAIQDHTIILTPAMVHPDVTDAYRDVNSRLQKFQQSSNDTLSIIWTEPRFNHWVNYIAHKVHGKVVVYKMNSIQAKTGTFGNRIIQMLQPGSTDPVQVAAAQATGAAAAADDEIDAETADDEIDAETAKLLKQFKQEHLRAREQRKNL